MSWRHAKITQLANISVGILTKAQLPPKSAHLTIPTSFSLTHSPTFSNCPLSSGCAGSETNRWVVQWSRWPCRLRNGQYRFSTPETKSCSQGPGTTVLIGNTQRPRMTHTHTHTQQFSHPFLSFLGCGTFGFFIFGLQN